MARSALVEVRQRFVNLAAELRGEEERVAGIDVGERLFARELELLSQTPAVFGQIISQSEQFGVFQQPREADHRGQVRRVDVVVVLEKQPIAFGDQLL